MQIATVLVLRHGTVEACFGQVLEDDASRRLTSDLPSRLVSFASLYALSSVTLP